MIGLDFGERRIGVAISDVRGVTARALPVIERESAAKDVARIRELAASRKVQKIIMGLPLNMDGSCGPAARRTRRFASLLRRELGIEVVMWDERLTTVEAERNLIAGGQRRQRRRALRDGIAASLILQQYLDAQRGSGQE